MNQLELDPKQIGKCLHPSAARTHAQTDGQLENIMLPVPHVGSADTDRTISLSPQTGGGEQTPIPDLSASSFQHTCLPHPLSVDASVRPSSLSR